jgi:hypothetical protein
MHAFDVGTPTEPTSSAQATDATGVKASQVAMYNLQHTENASNLFLLDILPPATLRFGQYETRPAEN